MRMNVISRPAILVAAQRHPQAAEWLNAWWKVAKSQQWTNLSDVRAVYPSADQVGGCLIFDAPKGCRLVVGVMWADETKNGTLFVKHFLTHAEYDKDKWKKGCFQ
jgi:mRNA interferase HigB